MTALAWVWLMVAVLLGIGAALLSRWQMFRDHREAARTGALLEPAPADDPERGRPRPWVIVNPSKHEDPQAFRDQVDRAAARHGITHVHWIDTTPEDPGTGQTLRALELGASVVVAAGGDGTVRAVAAGMAHSGVRMGILPVGTGNLLARNLGLPLDDVDAAVDVALGEDHRGVDLAWLRLEDVAEPADLPPEGALVAAAGAGSVRRLPDGVPEPREDEYAYVVISGLGFDGETMANTDATLKKRVGWPAYVVSALGAIRVRRMHSRLVLHSPVAPTVARPLHLVDVPPERIGIIEAADRGPISPAADEGGAAGGAGGGAAAGGAAGSGPTGPHDEVAELTARTVLFANCGELPFIVLAPDATLDDGLLDIIAVDTQAGLIGWMDLASKVVFQGAGMRALNMPTSMGHIAFRQAPAASVTVDRPHTVQVDGDALGSARTVHTRVEAGALDIAVPGD